jgi:phosphopantothenoylcysteine decarboxylase
VVPYTNNVMALHPTLHESLAKLRDWGVHVLYGDEMYRLGDPGQTDLCRHQFPWRRALQAVSSPVVSNSRVEPGAVS